MDQSQIYRKVSLERLSSPEQLDQALRIAGTKGWVALAAICILLLAALTWGFVGSITTSAIGQGILIRQGGVLNVVTRGEGIVLGLDAKPGDEISPSQVVATVAQPVLSEKIQSIENEIMQVKAEKEQTFSVHTNAARMQSDALDRQHDNTLLLISETEEQARVAEEQAKFSEQLFSKGLITREQAVSAKQKVTSLNDQISSLKLQLKQMDAQKFTIQKLPAEEDNTMRDRLQVLNDDLAEAKQQMSLAEHVTSPYGGEVLEVKIAPGANVTAGQPILSIQPRDSDIQLVAYVPTTNAKETKVGMPVQISPSMVKREEYGFMKGVVTYVASYPATQEALLSVFQNESLAKAFSGSGPVTEIRVSLVHQPQSPSGFAWSTRKGPSIRLTSGTMCTLRIITKEQRPLSLIFPFFKGGLGIE
jgi:HlyD family secretion protein